MSLFQFFLFSLHLLTVNYSLLQIIVMDPILKAEEGQRLGEKQFTCLVGELVGKAEPERRRSGYAGWEMSPSTMAL